MIKKFRILDVMERSFVSKETGDTVAYTQLLVRGDDGIVVKMPANKDFDFKPFLDKTVSLDVVTTTNKEYTPTDRAIGVIDEKK
jgi:hypothetical protein